MVWYFSYEEDLELQTLHPEGSSLCSDFARTSSDVASELLYYKECLSCTVEFINFTVWGNSPSLTWFRTDIFLFVELLVTWCFGIEDLLYMNVYKTDGSKAT